jgi:beta-glucanase (GH16 family)
VPYYNYLGNPMPETPTESGRIAGTSAGHETITAPAGDTSVSGEGGGDLLIGSAGGNRFWITNPNDVVQETAGGVDTEIGWLPITLAANVENLIVHQDFNHGVGNSLDNLIITDGRAWLDGRQGNDVLVGATNTTTTFVVRAGEGNDVIYNWQGADQVQLVGMNFRTAADVRAAMTQQGADVVLNLGGGQTLTFRGVDKSSGFLDKQFLLPLDTSKVGAPTLTEDFNGLNLYDYGRNTGLWRTNFGGNLKDQWAYTLPSNGEFQVYTAPGFEGLGNHDLHLNPFSVANGVLSITAQPIPAGDRDAAFGHAWSSGMLNTLDTFEQKYGYYEIRAQLPNAAGVWPAFWMRPSPYQPGQEGDVMEALGIQPSQDYIRAYGTESYLYENALKIDPGAWHTYGMLWTKDTLSFYLDGVQVMSGPTPASWTNPTGLILNMAVGGWGGEADASQYPATMNVDYIHVYALADGSTQVVNETPADPVGTIQDVAQPGGAPAAQAQTFADSGQPVSSARIVVLSHEPTAADLGSGRALVIWDSAGQVRAAVSNNGQLDAYTVVMAGSASQFTGAGTFLTNGTAVAAFNGSDQGQQAAWALLFNPATHTFTTHELGPSNGQVAFTAMSGGDFAASWHTPSGGVNARTYEAAAYDGRGWWAPIRSVAGDVSGVTSDGKLIAGGTVYGVARDANAVVGQVLSTPAGGGSLDGGDGPDTITASDGTTYIRAFAGDDKVTGGSGHNVMNGNIGNDTITGRSSVGDELSGGQGNDTISAIQSTAHNYLNGNKGDDSLIGSNAGDTLRGGQANDVIVGGSGADWISGDLGNDTVSGGGGGDTFSGFSGSGTMWVTDFHASEGDRVQIVGGGYVLSQRGADTVIDINGGGEVVLQNVAKDQLAAGWIFQT